MVDLSIEGDGSTTVLSTLFAYGKEDYHDFEE
jgi:hypothetical protein